jgi:hypothetical protein
VNHSDRRKGSWAAGTKAKPPQIEQDDFCILSARVRDDEGGRFWQETFFFIGTRAELGKLLTNLPPGARLYQGEKARAHIQRAIARCREGCQP